MGDLTCFFRDRSYPQLIRLLRHPPRKISGVHPLVQHVFSPTSRQSVNALVRHASSTNMKNTALVRHASSPNMKNTAPVRHAASLNMKNNKCRTSAVLFKFGLAACFFFFFFKLE